MSFRNILFGRPLASSEGDKEKLSVFTGVPVLGLDALASTGYGPEAALTILTPLGVAGLRYFPVIAIGIVALLAILYFSYRQTAAAYPGGGGAYVVAKDNLGPFAGLCAAVSLMLDYLLNVAVAISAGVGSVVSAFPVLHAYTLPLCLVVLVTLAFLNLRGVRESGLAFVLPVFAFIGCMAAAIALGLAHGWSSGGHPHALAAPPALPQARQAGLWVLLAAFANGCTAMTGIEAVSNGVPLFKRPSVANAQKTLTAIIATLGVFLLGLAYLCPAYGIGAMEEQKPGYQTVLSQLVGAVAGRGVFYYAALISIFIVLTYSAQTSFADFPRVCRFLAEDRFLPQAFAVRGRRLVFSRGIIVLALVSGVLLIVFGGVTDKLIPLFAVGSFGAFLFSQAGMVRHWHRKGGPGSRVKLFFNGLGAVATASVLVIIVLTKFLAGAWLVVLVAPGLVFLLKGIHRHYRRIERQAGQPLELSPVRPEPPAVVVPISGWDRPAEKAMRLGLLLSSEITALHVGTEQDDTRRLRELWAEMVEKPAREAGTAVPRLAILDSPYRLVHEPILDFLDQVRKERPGRLIAVIIPELVEPHWYESLLHDFHGKWLKTLLYLKRDDRTLVIGAPWYLRDR